MSRPNLYLYGWQYGVVVVCCVVTGLAIFLFLAANVSATDKYEDGERAQLEANAERARIIQCADVAESIEGFRRCVDRAIAEGQELK